MIYRIAGGIAFLLLGVSLLNILSIPSVITAIALVVAGIALLASL